MWTDILKRVDDIIAVTKMRLPQAHDALLELKEEIESRMIAMREDMHRNAAANEADGD
jgi:hypothetical protein